MLSTTKCLLNLFKKDKNQERKRALKNAYVRAIAHPNLAKISIVQASSLRHIHETGETPVLRIDKNRMLSTKPSRLLTTAWL
jgi:hypothetical protein